MTNKHKFNTLSLHAGQTTDEHGSRAVPIHQTTSYLFENTEQAAALYNMEVGGHIYTRLTNPTVAVLEQRLTALEGGGWHGRHIFGHGRAVPIRAIRVQSGRPYRVLLANVRREYQLCLNTLWGGLAWNPPLFPRTTPPPSKPPFARTPR